MPVCVPVRDMKDTAKFTALVNRERDIIVTKNGYEAFHCLSDEQYRLMQDEIAKARLLSRILLAEHEIETGSYSSFKDFAAEIKHDYGL